jgi:hypothetical protein
MAMMRRPVTPGRHRSQGQTLVEFALVLPIFLLVVFAVIDGGRYIFLSSALSNAAREGARLGSVEAWWKGSSDASCGTAGGPVCPANTTVLINHITAAANRQMAPFGSVDNVYIRCDAAGNAPPTGNWTTKTCTGNSAGGTISVRVNYTWDAITPLVANIMGSITTSGSATVSIN